MGQGGLQVAGRSLRKKSRGGEEGGGPRPLAERRSPPPLRLGGGNNTDSDSHLCLFEMESFIIISFFFLFNFNFQSQHTTVNRLLKSQFMNKNCQNTINTNILDKSHDGEHFTYLKASRRFVFISLVRFLITLFIMNKAFMRHSAKRNKKHFNTRDGGRQAEATVARVTRCTAFWEQTHEGAVQTHTE